MVRDLQNEIKRIIMKALTLKQPWASLLFTPVFGEMGEVERLGLKTIETRKWATGYRGDLLITTSLKDDKSYRVFDNFTEPPVCRYCGCKDHLPCPEGCWWIEEDLCSSCEGLEPKGCAIGIVELYDVQTMTQEHQDAAKCLVYPKAQSFFLRNPRPILPFPIKGQLNIWNADVDPADLLFLKRPIHPQWGKEAQS